MTIQDSNITKMPIGKDFDSEYGGFIPSTLLILISLITTFTDLYSMSRTGNSTPIIKKLKTISFFYLNLKGFYIYSLNNLSAQWNYVIKNEVNYNL